MVETSEGNMAAKRTRKAKPSPEEILQQRTQEIDRLKQFVEDSTFASDERRSAVRPFLPVHGHLDGAGREVAMRRGTRERGNEAVANRDEHTFTISASQPLR